MVLLCIVMHIDSEKVFFGMLAYFKLLVKNTLILNFDSGFCIENMI